MNNDDKKEDLLERNSNKRLKDARYKAVKKHKESHLREWMMFLVMLLVLLSMLIRYI